MRINLVSAGAVIVIVGYFLDLLGFLSFLITIPVGLINIFLGGITPKRPGVTLQAGPSSPIRLVVDKGVVGSNTYELVFLGGKLILKRLSSASLTIVTPLVLTIGGFLIVNSLIGAIIGGMTGISLQEYLTQRRRDKITATERLATTGTRDLEVRYDQLEKVEVTRSRIYLFLKDRVIRINISRRYSKRIAPVLETILSSKYQLDDTSRSGRDPGRREP